eukprot:UC4_evm2s255
MEHFLADQRYDAPEESQQEVLSSLGTEHVIEDSEDRLPEESQQEVLSSLGTEHVIEDSEDRLPEEAKAKAKARFKAEAKAKIEAEANNKTESQSQGAVAASEKDVSAAVRSVSPLPPSSSPLPHDCVPSSPPTNQPTPVLFQSPRRLSRHSKRKSAASFVSNQDKCLWLDYGTCNTVEKAKAVAGILSSNAKVEGWNLDRGKI